MRRSFLQARISLLAAAAAAAIGSSPAQAAAVNWTGATSFWDLVTNWGSNPLLPGPADDVVINVAGLQTVTHRSGTDTVNSLSLSGDDLLAVTGGTLTVANAFGSSAGTSLSAGTLTLNGSSSMASLAQSGGTLAGSGTTTIGGASSWLAGTQTGSGVTRFQGAAALSGAGTKVISGGRTVDLNGTTTWSGNTANNNNALQFAGGTLNNLGTFNDQNAFASAIVQFSGSNAFNNTGTYNKQSNTVTTVEILYNNSGTTNVNAGTLLMQGASTTGASGVFNLAAGATLEFRNGTHTLDNPTISGLGTFAISTENVGADAVVTLNGGTLTSPFLLSGSTLAGTDRVFQGRAAWTGGTLSGTAVTTFKGDVTISGANVKVIVGGGTVNLNGTTTWSGNTGNNNNAIRFWNGATINNNGTFNDANPFASFIEHNTGGPHNFNNIGTYNKQSDTITTVDLGVAFNNAGTLNVNAGTFRPTGGTSTGTFNIAAGAVLDFRNGNNTLDNVTVRGPGTFLITSDNVGADAVVAVNGGTLSAPFVLSGSTLTGSNHSFQGPVSWTGGAISGAASTTIANDITISGAATKTLVGGRILNLNGTTTWSGNTASNNNAIRFWNGATINNNGTFNDANAFGSFIEHNTGGPHNFNNIGTYNKQSNTLTTVDLGVAFNNTGTVNVNAGTLQVVSALTNRGLVNVAAGATLMGSNASFVNAGTLAGNGTVATHANGDVVNQGAINPGFGIGRLTLLGALNQQAPGALNIDLASLASFDQLAVTDDVTLDGSIVAWNAGYVPVLGDKFVVLTFDQRLGNTTFGSVSTQGYGPGVAFEAIYNLHDVSLVVVAVPEPETFALLLAGLVLIGTVVRRRGS